MVNDELAGQHHRHQPEESTPTAYKKPDDRQDPLQQIFRIEEGETDKHDAFEFGLELPLFAAAVPVEKFGAVGRQLIIEEVGKIELSQELNHIFLTGSAVRISFNTGFPDLLHGPVRS
jgi:hypothetical protein